MKVVDIANEFYEEFGKPTDLTIAAISYWLRSNIGQLNVVINASFYINSDLNIVRIDPNDSSSVIEIGYEEKDVYKSIFQVYFIDREIRKNLLTYTSSSVIEITEDGYSLRMTSPTEIGRNLYTFRKAATDVLQNAIAQYKINKARPRQVAGDDTIPGCDDISESLFRRVSVWA